MTAEPRSTLGRNDPCHCGSGRKYKQCCLSKDEAEARAARVAAAEAAAAADASPQAAASDAASTAKTPKAHTHQPWKKAATNTHGFQRRSSVRKVGGS
ncbi:MAG: SEC-C metal-binding domain-containing protein [Vicinamibacterales bacterium]